MSTWHLQHKNGLTCHIIHGASEEVLKDFQGQADLIMTSPPYADARKAHYESVKPDEYAQWLSQFHTVFWLALKPSGSLVINIRDKVVKGIRHRYVWETIQMLSLLGWQAIEDYVWHKRNSMPGRWPTRLRDAWEVIFHLAKTKRPYFNQAAVQIPVSAATQQKLAKLDDHNACSISATGSGFIRDLRAWQGKTHVSPTNVLHLATETHNRKHPAVYPVSLPLFFIKLLSKPEDLVIDPFAGSGSTGIAAIRAGRHCVLIDNKYDYCLVAKERLEKECQMEVVLKDKGRQNHLPHLFNLPSPIAKPFPEPLNSSGNKVFNVN